MRWLVKAHGAAFSSRAMLEKCQEAPTWHSDIAKSTELAVKSRQRRKRSELEYPLVACYVGGCDLVRRI
jgi:hypothetical protein